MRSTKMRERDQLDPPANWEPLAECPPATWQRFRRAGGLEDRLASLDAELDAEEHRRTRQATRLYHEIPAALRALAGPDPSAIWATILETIATVSREWAWQLSGTDETPERARVRKGTAVFGTVGQALAHALHSGHLLGLGPQTFVVAEDQEADVNMRRTLRARGRQRPLDDRGQQRPGYLPIEWMPAKQSRAGILGGTKSGRQVDLRADVVAAIEATRIDGRPLTVLDVELLVAADVGVYTGGARRTKSGVLLPAYEPRKARELAAMIDEAEPEGAPTSASAAGHRVGRLRRELQRELAWRGLTPPPRERYEVQVEATLVHRDAKPENIDEDPWAAEAQFAAGWP